jgi:MFS family permease
MCIISLTAFFTRTAAVFQLIPLIGHDQFALGVDLIGLAVTITAFTILLMVPISAPLTDRFGARAIVLWSTLASGGALWMLYASTSLFGFWLGVVLFGLAAGINYPAIGSFTISALPRERYGPGMGMQRTFGDVGFVFGPVIIGALADLTGDGNLAGVAFNVAILFVASFFFWIVSRGMRRES